MMDIGGKQTTAYNGFMDANGTLVEREAGSYAPLSDATIVAMGTVLAAASRWIGANKHWLSVALFLTIASKTFAFLIAAITRSVRERGVASCIVIATPFAVLLRHLSRPPQVWAAQ